MPVFNGERTIAKSIESVLSQEFSDWKLLVSDNFSSDRTAEIVLGYAKLDSRIALRSRHSTVPASANFSGLTDDVTTPFFVFLPADDCWQSDFLSATYEELSLNRQAVLATGLVSLGGVKAHGTFAILDRRAGRRVQRYLMNPSDNSRYYGLMRTDAVRSIHCSLVKPIFGLDWFQMAQSLCKGTHIEIPRILMERNATPLENYYRNNSNAWGGWPLLEFSVQMARWMPLQTAYAFPQLLLLNWRIGKLQRSILNEKCNR